MLSLKYPTCTFSSFHPEIIYIFNYAELNSDKREFQVHWHFGNVHYLQITIILEKWRFSFNWIRDLL